MTTSNASPKTALITGSTDVNGLGFTGLQYSKTALNMVTLMQAKNLPAIVGPNLKVNAASPGHVKTPFNNYSGVRTLEEGAGVYAYLATLNDDGPTGQLIGNHAPFSTDGSFVQLPW